MYIKYKSISDNKISIINVDISNCEYITTDGDKLIINMPKESKKIDTSIRLNSNDDAIKALEKLFSTLYNKAPIGNLLDLINLDEQVEVDNSQNKSELDEE